MTNPSNPYEAPREADAESTSSIRAASRFNVRPLLTIVAACNLAYALMALSQALQILKSVNGLGWLIFYVWLSWMFFCFVLNISFRIAMIVFAACLIAASLLAEHLH